MRFNVGREDRDLEIRSDQGKEDDKRRLWNKKKNLKRKRI